MSGAPAGEEGVLAGVRVLDFTQVLAGPTVTRLMAEMGAEVVKVELAPHGELGRGMPYMRDGRSGYHIQQNRGKKSLCVDVKHPEGHDLIERLLPNFDVVVESFSPGAIDRLGFSWETIHAANPRAIMCSVSTFGQKGQLALEPGYDNIGQAYAGITSMNGESDRTPMLLGAAVGDVLTGVHGLAAVTSALYYRERTGRGQRVEVSLLDCYFTAHEVNVQLVSGSGGSVVPRRFGPFHYATCPYGIFSAGSDYVFVAVPADHQWVRLCKAMGRDDLADDPRYATNAARVERHGEVSQMVQTWLDGFDDRDQAIAACRAERVPVAPILSVEEAMRHPHLRESRTVRTVPDRVWGEIDIPGFPLRFSEQPDELDLEAPFLGEHNREILAGELDLAPDQIDDLVSRGIVADEPIPASQAEAG